MRRHGGNNPCSAKSRSRVLSTFVFLDTTGITNERRHPCGNLIRRYDYGRTTKHGWEIDHIRPVAKGGTDILSNLQPAVSKNTNEPETSAPASNQCWIDFLRSTTRVTQLSSAQSKWTFSARSMANVLSRRTPN